MGVIQIATVRKRALALLLADSRTARYTDAVGQNSRYPVLTQFTDTILGVDQAVCGVIIDTPGHPFASGFMATQAALANGDQIPAHTGALGQVNVKLATDADYQNGLLASSEDEIAEILSSTALYPSPGRWYYIKGVNIYHTGEFASVDYPVLARMAACQADQRYEDVEVYGTVSNLQIDGADPSFFSYYSRLYQAGLQLVAGRATIIPEEAQLAMAA